MIFRPPIPREHGAWGMLLVPPVVTAGALGHWPGTLWLLLACCTALFMARAAAEALLELDPRRPLSTPTARRDAIAGLTLYTLAAVLTGLPLAREFGLQWTLTLAVGGGLLSLLYFGLLLVSGTKTLLGEVFGVALLTLTAPAAALLIARDVSIALRFWLIHYLFFLSGLLYVKAKLEARKNNFPLNTLADRLAQGRLVLGYHLALVLLVVGMVRHTWLPAFGLVAFAPIVARAFWGVFRWERRLSLPRLGRAELLHSLAFAVLLAMAFRL